jgi:hypothetical protein
VQDERDHCEHEKQVNQAAGDVEYGESSDPRYQQYNEQDRPDAHVASLSPSSVRGR